MGHPRGVYRAARAQRLRGRADGRLSRVGTAFDCRGRL